VECRLGCFVVGLDDVEGEESGRGFN